MFKKRIVYKDKKSLKNNKQKSRKYFLLERCCNLKISFQRNLTIHFELDEYL